MPAPGALPPIGPAQTTFVNWESPHVHPLDLTPDGARLLAVNSADATLEVFDAGGDTLRHWRSIPTGVDPIRVRARNDREAWVIDHVGDAALVVDLPTGRVRATLETDDEPCDVVFAGVPERAFVSCSQANTLLVFDPANLQVPPTRIELEAEDPRSLAVSPDGATVYAAIFESGNGTTVLGGGGLVSNYPPDAVGSPLGPHGGLNPPPNAGAVFDPPLEPGNPTAPKVALIVRQDEFGAWRDDTGADWTDIVSGPQAHVSGRPTGWTLLDRDVAVIDVGSLEVSWVSRLMNVNAAVAVHPLDGTLAIVGTDASNEVRFEPNQRGTFVRARLALVDPDLASSNVVDLNPHLTYDTAQLPQNERDLALGEPRAIAFLSDGTRAFVAGQGSNNLVVVDANGARAGTAPTIEVAEGPTGLALHENAGRLYVLGRFESAISVVDLENELEIQRVPFHDATPESVRTGRRLLYDTHGTSGLGHVSCASCHIDGRMDRLAWDLGDPGGSTVPTAGMNLAANHPLIPHLFPDDLHPMKGPMLTQTLQDIIGKEPLHWRGDRAGIEGFAGAYMSLLGDDSVPDAGQMQTLAEYLKTLHFPPNPFRTLLNELPDELPLPGHTTTGRFAPAGMPLPAGDATRGLELFVPPNLFDGEVACATCHTLPTGRGPNYTFVDFAWQPLPDGPGGERNHMLTMDGTQTEPIAVPQLRNLYDRVGFQAIEASSRSGFGFSHNGSIDTLERFISQPLFHVQSDQDIADLVAFVLSFSGSDLPGGWTTNGFQAPGAASLDTHAGVGTQTTLLSLTGIGAEQFDLIDDLHVLAELNEIALVARQPQAGAQRGFTYAGFGLWQSDRAGELITTVELQNSATPGSEVTYVAVPIGSETRLALDRDGDGHFDGDELDAFSDPASATSIPQPCVDGPPPTASGLVAESAGVGRVALSWTPNGFAHRIERTPLGEANFDLVADVDSDLSGFVDSGLDCGTAYDYRVTVRNCAGESTPEVIAALAGVCDALTTDTTTISVSTGGRQTLWLRAPIELAGNPYVVLGSLSGTEPGLPLAGALLPLNVDGYFVFTLENINLDPLVNTLGTLDATARGKAAIELAPGSASSLSGLTLHHAFVVLDGALEVAFASNAVELVTTE